MFVDRRRRFFKGMKDGVAIVCSAPVMVRNQDTEYPYRQDSDFLYLTGFEEPESIAVLIKAAGVTRFILFVRPVDPDMEVWVGPRAGIEGACSRFGADEAYPTPTFFDHLAGLLTNQPRLYLGVGRNASFETRVFSTIETLKGEGRKGITGPWEILDPRMLLWEQRLIKSRGEIQAIVQACDVTSAGVMATMRASMPGMMEYELAAVAEFEYRRRGSPRLAFDTICAAGNNAATLHYTRNNTRIQDGDMILVDTGCEIGDVSADITRTFPANGRFTQPGRTVYEWVLRAQKAAVDAVRPGATYASVHEAALAVLCEALIDLHVLRGNVKQVMEEGTYKPYFMHRIGHWLGADVHDVGPYFEDGQSIQLRPGMVMTIEPGLYLANNVPAPAALKGIGVRIEDDVLITPTGNRVLTPKVPREVADIERAMKDRGAWWGKVEPASL